MERDELKKRVEAAMDLLRSIKEDTGRDTQGDEDRLETVYGSLPDREQLVRAWDISKLLHVTAREQASNNQLKRDITRITDTLSYYAVGDRELVGEKRITQFYSFDLEVVDKTGIDAVSCQVSIPLHVEYPTVRVDVKRAGTETWDERTFEGRNAGLYADVYLTEILEQMKTKLKGAENGETE